MESFGTEKDFENGHWGNDGEFYGKRRDKRPAQTKDDVLYGVFASGDSDSSDGGGGSRKRRKELSKKATDFTKPVSFVSIGTVMPTQEIDRNTKEDNSNNGSGLGFASSSGLGFGANGADVDMQEEEEEDDADEDNFLPTALGKKIKTAAQQRRDKEREEKLKSSKKNSSSKKDVGQFEQHTKGIGKKLLEKMGYKGGGLGKNAQGIVAPIEAKLRPKNMGMGFNDYKEVTLPTLKELVDEKNKKKGGLPLGTLSKEKAWTKSKHTRLNSNKKKKDDYMTVEELLAMKQEQGVEVVSQKVFDMRGPQVRVLTNLEDLNAEENARENDVHMPELQHNVRLIVDLAELEIQKIDRDLRNERELVVTLQKEKKRLEIEDARQKKQLDDMVEIAGVLERISEEKLSGSLTLDSLARSFRDLQKRFLEEYKLCNLSCMACSFALPLFIQVFQAWDPLLNPSHGLEVISLWKNLLQIEDFGKVFMEVIVPAVRKSGNNTWQATDPEPMLSFLDSWEHLMPAPVLNIILDNIVLPKLSAAVESWDPRRERIAIHSWLHPWLPLLRTKLETFYPTIRFRLESVLHAWHPSDISAYTILSPWKTVFDPVSWENLMVRCIIPKLLEVMNRFQINPLDQKLDEFYWVKRWASVIPVHHMIHLMDLFFNKWQEVLYHWLCSTSPNFEQVTQWYLGWKDLIPTELLANEHIRYRLNLGLDMMNQAVEGMEVSQPGLKEKVSYLRVLEQRQFEKAAAAASAPAQQQKTEMSLKEVIETYAEQNGLLFMPKPGRMQNSHQIYGFGKISIFLDSLNQKVYAQIDDRWQLVSLEQMLDLHNRRR